MLLKFLPFLVALGLISAFNVNPVKQNAEDGKISVVVLLKAS